MENKKIVYVDDNDLCQKKTPWLCDQGVFHLSQQEVISNVMRTRGSVMDSDLQQSPTSVVIRGEK